MTFLSDEQLNALLPAESSTFASPVPTRIVASDEYLPVPQTSWFTFSRVAKHAERTRRDRFAALRADYVANGGRRGNLRYGYVAAPA